MRKVSGAYLDHACIKSCKPTYYTHLKIDAIYALYPESFCNKNPAIWKVFAFSDSD